MNAPTTQNSEINCRIFLTSKTRMTSESKLRNRARFTSALSSLYAFYLIVYSILDSFKLVVFQNFGVISIIFSSALFGLSLYWQGQRDFERADAYKQCYLKLQKLEADNLTDEEKTIHYFDILSIYENQTDDDYDEMTVDALLRGQKIYNSRNDITPNNWTIFKVFTGKICRYSFAAILIIWPLSLTFF